jgi:N-carbamoylputrescine amidase
MQRLLPAGPVDSTSGLCYLTAMAEPSRKLSIGLVQMAGSEDLALNLEKGIAGVREAASRGAQVVCLQELFRSQYFCQREDAALFDLAEPIPGPTTRALSAEAASRGVAVVAPVFERRAAGVYHNSLVVIDAGGALLGTYRKMHIPDDPQYFEKFYFTPGDLGYRVFETRHGRIGALICWDQWYPEAARITALMGAEVIFYPTAIGWHPREKALEGAAQREAWITAQRAHAIASGVFVAAVNRVGHEGPPAGGIEFWGSSFVADPLGVVLRSGSTDCEEVLVVECDRSRIETVRRGWPFLRDRRIDSYGPISQRLIDER